MSFQGGRASSRACVPVSPTFTFPRDFVSVVLGCGIQGYTLMKWWVIVAFAMLFIPVFAEDTAPAATSTGDVSTAQAEPVMLPPPSDEAVRFYRTGNALWGFRTLWGLLVPAVIVFTGLSARMRTVAQRIGKQWFFVIAAYVVLFTLLTFLIDLPLSFYSDYVRMHDFGLSNQTFGKWVYDSIMQLGVVAFTAAMFLWVPYLLLRKSPKRWWLYTGLLMYPFFAFQLLVSPLWIDPLFNTFGPMKDKALEAKILAVADRAGIEGSRVFEVDKSIDTKAYNAYVTGMFNSKRIVLWDTTIKGLSEPQVLYVMAHEIGHFVLGHTYSGIAVFGTLYLIAFYFVHLSSGWILRRYGNRIGFNELSDIASYPLMILLISIALLVLQPFALAYNRHQEHEADRFGLELTQDNHAAASAFAKMYKDNLGYPNPHPIIKILRASHPPLGERVDFCNTYKPWADGSAMRYAGMFQPGPTLLEETKTPEGGNR